MKNIIIADCVCAVTDFFKGDTEKARLWFATENPMMGNVSPQQMIDMNRVEKLFAFIEYQLSLNSKI